MLITAHICIIRCSFHSFTHEVKKLQKDYPAVLTIPTLPLSKQDFTNPCENTTSGIQIKTTIPQLEQGQ